MARIVEAKTQCPCGCELNFTLKKPTILTPTISTIQCPECQSKFLAKMLVDKESDDRQYITQFHILDITAKAKSALRANKVSELA